MNIIDAHQLLSAAARQDVPRLPFSGPPNCKTGRDMANAGLIEI